MMRLFAIASDPTLINESITAPSMRVIFMNKETSKSEWKIMDRAEALQFAKKMNLDLVLGVFLLMQDIICDYVLFLIADGKSTPVVCKLEDYKLKIRELKQREKEKAYKETTEKVHSKQKPLKEVFIRVSYVV